MALRKRSSAELFEHFLGLKKLEWLDFSMVMEKSDIRAVEAAQTGIHAFAAGTVLKAEEMFSACGE